jgi:hypothetical protein
MPSLEPFCEITASMTRRILGNMPLGTRIDFPFEGVATSQHWDGEREVRGVDYVTLRPDGNMDLQIRGTIVSKRDTVAYQATGVSLGISKTEARPQELITFQTGNEELSWLNNVIGVGLGNGEGMDLSLTIYVVRSADD